MPDKKKSFRVERVNSYIQKVLGEIFLDLFSEKSALITISKVECSKDLRWAKVWVSVLGGNDDVVFQTILSNIYDVQGELNRKMTLKMIPRLQFFLDTSPRYVQGIDEVIRKIHEEDGRS